MRRVSLKRQRENRVRRSNLIAAYGTDPVCRFPDCTRPAVDGHELLSRARGGSITDVSNIVPICRPHHNYVTTHPREAALLGLALSRKGA